MGNRGCELPRHRIAVDMGKLRHALARGNLCPFAAAMFR